jgi:AraC-like DNA-binding protein
MIADTSLNFYTVFTFLGVIQGLVLSYFFIRKGINKSYPNVLQGVLLLTLSLAIFEEFLNSSGYIVQVLWLTNFTEPFNFIFAPLFYLYIKRSLKPEFKRKDLLHLAWFVFWAGYMIFHFAQPNEIKYNSYIYSKHPDWPVLDVEYKFTDDPLGIRRYCNQLTGVSFVVYMFFSIRHLLADCKSNGIALFRTDNPKYRNLGNISLHFMVIVIIFIVVKLSFKSDVGDYFIGAYISFMFFSTGFRIINSSSYFDQTASFMDFPLVKYKKSTLSEEAKDDLLGRIEDELITKQYFLNNMASLSELARILKVSTHHVSQVINERLQMNFFELLAKHRVEEAKKILLSDREKKITIEDLADQVGYNSKSAFNNAFKKLTGKTPSEFREINNI